MKKLITTLILCLLPTIAWGQTTQKIVNSRDVTGTISTPTPEKLINMRFGFGYDYEGGELKPEINDGIYWSPDRKFALTTPIHIPIGKEEKKDYPEGKDGFKVIYSMFERDNKKWSEVISAGAWLDTSVPENITFEIEGITITIKFKEGAGVPTGGEGVPAEGEGSWPW